MVLLRTCAQSSISNLPQTKLELVVIHALSIHVALCNVILEKVAHVNAVECGKSILLSQAAFMYSFKG